MPFLSTLSLRRATIVHLALFNRTIYISIHALLAESDGCAPSANGGVASISIHALLAESDSALAAEENPTQYFYPRSPCGERQFQMHHQARHNLFLSTLSLRRATTARSLFSIVIPFLSTLSLRRATINSRANNVKRNISIHALLAESDRHPKMSDHPHNTFLSTLSLRRATAKVHKTVGHFCAYETNFMEIASSC